MKISMKLFYEYINFSLFFHLHQVIFVHYKSRIATAIRGLQWTRMTMVNSGLKGLKNEHTPFKNYTCQNVLYLRSLREYLIAVHVFFVKKNV